VIEEGFFNNSISESVIHTYLSDPELDGIRALILGCTHYPLVKEEIEAYYAGAVEVIDASRIVAESVRRYLADNGLLKGGEGSFRKFSFPITPHRLKPPRASSSGKGCIWSCTGCGSRPAKRGLGTSSIGKVTSDGSAYGMDRLSLNLPFLLVHNALYRERPKKFLAKKCKHRGDFRPSPNIVEVFLIMFIFFNQ
jgi:hypothetical protein